VPFVLQHAASSQVFTTILVNHYQLAYYGVKFWESEEEAEGEYGAFLQEKGQESMNEWKIIEMDEAQMKLSNVKLKNDPRLKLYWSGEGQRPEARLE
jgi:hypothetical protein